MPEPTAPQTPTTLQATAGLVEGAMKVAAAARERLAKAPKAVDPALAEKTAAVLVETGWIDESRKAAVAAALADPTTALESVQNLARKTAEELGRRVADPRLAAGTPVGGPAPTKAAADESPADRAYREKLQTYRPSLNGAGR